MEISGQIHKNSLNYSLFSSVNSSIGLSGVAGDASTMFFGTISGGITAELTGGNFWQGAAIGLAVSALNHVAHKIEFGDFLDERAKQLFGEDYKEKFGVSKLKLGSSIGKKWNYYQKWKSLYL